MNLRIKEKTPTNPPPRGEFVQGVILSFCDFVFKY